MLLYQGHFPGQPVVPGVCTLQIIKESAEQIASQPLQYVQIASSKFLSAINPLETPLLQLFIRLEKTEEHLFKLQAEGICNGKEFIKLKAVLMASKYQMKQVLLLNIHNSKNNKSIYTCQHLSNFLYLDNLNLILMKKGWQQIMLYLIVLTSYGCLSDEDKCIRQLVQG